nr:MULTISPECIES: restriction endonuclease subunit S [unclassified Granulicatella]
MFPAKDEKIPKVRFANFEGDWEERKLEKIAPLRGGFAFKSLEFQNSGIPIVRISNILSNGKIGGEFEYYVEQDKDENYLLPDKAVVLAMSGATTGKVAILSNDKNKKIYQNQRVGYFQPIKGIDYRIVSTVVSSNIFLSQLKSVLVSGAQPNVSVKEINAFKFLLPKSFEEQTKISQLFIALNTNIFLQQSKVEHLQKLKTIYLQQCQSKMKMSQNVGHYKCNDFQKNHCTYRAK